MQLWLLIMLSWPNIWDLFDQIPWQNKQTNLAEVSDTMWCDTMEKLLAAVKLFLIAYVFQRTENQEKVDRCWDKVSIYFLGQINSCLNTKVKIMNEMKSQKQTKLKIKSLCVQVFKGLQSAFL